MILVDAERVHALLDYPSLIEALNNYHRQDICLLEDLLLEQPSMAGTPTHFFLRAAWQPQQDLGTKVVTIFPDNKDTNSGLPAVQAVYLLFDGSNGQPKACIDGTALTYRKTAADSGLGAKYLAREDAEIMLMVGAGALAPHLIMAHTAVRPTIRKVLIWNRTAIAAERLASTLSLGNIEISATDDLASAAGDADVISCATMSPTPLIQGQWLQPGAHLDLVGAFTKETREADDEAVRRSKLFVDCRATTVKDCGEICIPIATGIITERDIRADHFDFCTGRHPGREHAEDITFFKNGGGGHLDLMTARFTYLRFESS